MADLPNNSFVKVNDVETAQGAPVSEALAQKYGTNENTNNNEIVLNDTDIATNVTNIATNVTNIATNVTDIATNAAAIVAVLQPEIFSTILTPTVSSQTIFTFAAPPPFVTFTTKTLGGGGSGVAIILTSGETFVGGLAGNNYTLTGAALTVARPGGGGSITNFYGSGWT